MLNSNNQEKQDDRRAGQKPAIERITTPVPTKCNVTSNSQ